jgi:hypothetical protein
MTIIEEALGTGLHGEAFIRYVEMRRSGESHNIAEVLAARRFCAVKSDKIFNEGRFSSDAGKNGLEQQWLRQQAEAAGVSTNGLHYMRGLADYPGDPRAWIGGRSDVLRVAREKNMTVHGYVEHKAHDVDLPEDKGYRVADDIIDAETDEIVSWNPKEFAPIREQIREDVVQNRTGLVDNHPLVLDDSPQVIPGPSF